MSFNEPTKTLGRGLSSLIGNNSKTAPTQNPTETPYFPKTKKGVSNQILNLPIEIIKTNPHQPRTEFKETALNDLVSSIKEHGILQPLIVTQTMAGNYELIAGERRLRAAARAGLKEIPAIVRTAKDLEKLELSLIENIQRQDLNPIEKAISYKKLSDEFNLTHEEASRRLGISRAQFSNMIRLLGLPTDVQQGLTAGKISLSQAKVLLEVKDDKQRGKIYREATRGIQTVEDTRREVKKIKVGGHIRQITKDPQIKKWEDDLSQKLNTRAYIRQRGKFGGIIQIEFYSEEELRGIIEEILQ